MKNLRFLAYLAVLLFVLMLSVESFFLRSNKKRPENEAAKIEELIEKVLLNQFFLFPGKKFNNY